MAQHSLDQLWVINPTDKPFEVRWAGNPYVLNAGQKVIWPRFLAEHFAKRLADSILLAREAQHRKDYMATGKPMSEYIQPSYLNSKTMRPEVVNSILVGVYQYHTPQANDPGAIIQQQIDQMNQNVPQSQPQSQEDKSVNMGTAVDPLMGILQDDEEPESTPPAPQPPVDPNPPLPTTPAAPTTTPTNETPLQKHSRLTREAKQLGIKVNPGMTTAQLEEEMRKQYA